MSSDLLFLTCPPRIVKPLVEELTTHLEADNHARIVKYGVLCKGRDGFIILAIAHPESFPAHFLDALRMDEEITGYVTLTSNDNDFLAGMEADHDNTQ